MTKTQKNQTNVSLDFYIQFSDDHIKKNFEKNKTKQNEMSKFR